MLTIRDKTALPEDSLQHPSAAALPSAPVPALAVASWLDHCWSHAIGSRPGQPPPQLFAAQAALGLPLSGLINEIGKLPPSGSSWDKLSHHLGLFELVCWAAKNSEFAAELMHTGVAAMAAYIQPIANDPHQSFSLLARFNELWDIARAAPPARAAFIDALCSHFGPVQVEQLARERHNAPWPLAAEQEIREQVFEKLFVSQAVHTQALLMEFLAADAHSLKQVAAEARLDPHLRLVAFGLACREASEGRDTALIDSAVTEVRNLYGVTLPRTQGVAQVAARCAVPLPLACQALNISLALEMRALFSELECFADGRVLHLAASSPAVSHDGMHLVNGRSCLDTTYYSCCQPIAEYFVVMGHELTHSLSSELGLRPVSVEEEHWGPSELRFAAALDELCADVGAAALLESKGVKDPLRFVLQTFKAHRSELSPWRHELARCAELQFLERCSSPASYRELAQRVFANVRSLCREDPQFQWAAQHSFEQDCHSRLVELMTC